MPGYRLRTFVIECLCVALPKLLSGAGTTAVQLVLLRYLGPEPYGMYALCVTGILLADGVLGSALDMGVLRLAPLYRLHDRTRSLAIEHTALLLKGALAAGTGGVLLVYAEPLSRYLFQHDGTALLLYLSSAAICGLLMLRSSLVHLQVEQQFAQYGLLDLAHNVGKFGGIALVLGCVAVTPAMLLACFALAPGAVFVVYLVTYGRVLWPRLPLAPGAGKELLGAVHWSLLTFGLGTLSSRLDIVLLTMQATMTHVGLFSGAQTFALIPELLGTYLGVVLSPRIMPLYQAGRFFPFFRRFQLASFGACGVCYVLAWLSMERVAPWLLPATFAPSAKLILVLLPGALAGLATFPLTIAFLMFVRPKFLVAMECVAAPLVVLLYLYAIQQHGALGAAWVTSGSRVLKAALAQAVAWKWARRTPMMPAGSRVVSQPE